MCVLSLLPCHCCWLRHRHQGRAYQAEQGPAVPVHGAAGSAGAAAEWLLSAPVSDHGDTAQHDAPHQPGTRTPGVLGSCLLYGLNDLW